MSALHRHGRAAPMPCRSRVSGRYMPATHLLADRLDKVDGTIENAFVELRAIGALLDRAAAGTLTPADTGDLRIAHDILWSALDKIGDSVAEVRKLVGVANG